MQTIKKVLMDDLHSKLGHSAHIQVFLQKVLAVLLGEVLSSTAYEIITVIMVGDGSMSNAQALIARSIYAVLISIYAPVAECMIKKRVKNPQSFWGCTALSHANICAVLLAWGWKNWAAALDTFAGAELWDEAVIALAMTILVVAAQSAPCFGKNKAAVAAGGDEDTVMARFMVIPASLGLTLGYLWNLVATYFVSKVQALESSYHFDFMIQAVYALIACTSCTVIVCQLKKPRPIENGRSQSVNDWSGLTAAPEGHLKALTCTVLSFVYGWALLDTCDDWGFGVMFNCSSYSACSYQSNFAYSLAITICFTGTSFLLCRLKDFEPSDSKLSQAVSLQINAMVLTVGWAWMNFYSTIMSDATSGEPAGTKVLEYFSSMLCIVVLHSLSQFIATRTHAGWVRKTNEALETLESIADGSSEKKAEL